MDKLLKRSQNFIKREDDLIRDNFGTILEIHEQDENDIKIISEDAYIVDRKIPKEIEEYFFFDGALLGKYFQDTSSLKIKNTIFEISQLNLIENMEKNFDTLIKNYNNRLKKIAPKLGIASEKITHYEDKINEKEKELDDSKIKVKDADEQIKKIENELIDKNYKDITESVKERKKIEKQLGTLKSNITLLKASRNKLILDTYPVLLSYDILLSFLEKIEDSRRKHFIPPEYTKNFIKDLLEEKRCICGVSLETNENSRTELEKILNQTPDITDKAGDISRASAKVENLISEIRSFKSELKEIKLKLRNNEKEYDEKLERDRNIATMLRSNPEEDIKNLTIMRDDYLNIRQQFNRKIGSLENEILHIKNDKKEWEQQKNKEAKWTIEAETLENKINFIKNSKKIIKEMSTELSSEIHDKIQKLTKEKFIKIIWKEDEFINIEINKNYEIAIVNKLGEHESPGDLSDGEKLCLGLCFMSALHNISGFDLPIIMDTPLGNLDKDIRQNIARFLPDFIGEKQCVLLVTGTEYTDDFRDIICDNVGKEYLIKWENSDEGKESKVILNG
ncbi:hypothetical protein [Methanobrevibacter filiformis]|uniref:Chromosome segregation protein n=1 Tax=Methanobrevibacter filiformis TaxID=55758 RepID=A0A165ZQQ7_9EURY|nr:hypothetical protein [Methanobrevibacter filiformis]KZX11041.1 chromosome segregation protein [Methanobrevibacter filiformis]